MDYSRTRAYIPEDIIELLHYVKEGDRVLDSGCGDGRVLKILRERKVDYYGIDFSEELLKIARKNFPEGKFYLGNVLSLPFPESFFDKILSISVLHHIPSKEFRMRYLTESWRVLRPGGLLILRVWDFFKRGISFFKYFFKFATLKLFNVSRLDFFDIFFPWKNSQGKVIANRYFHCFTKGELEKYLRQAQFQIIKSWRKGFKQRANLYVIAQK